MGILYINERQRRRNLYSQTYNNRHDDNVSIVQDEEVILRDTFKCARNVIPKFFIDMIVD
jgi:hypothetical protein